MKVFIQSQSGEDGPFSPPELRRLFEQGKILGDQLCRIDGSTEMKPLIERFPEFVTEYFDPEEDAREKRWAQRKKKRIRFLVGGSLLFVTGIVFLFTPSPLNGVFMVICGFFLFVHGCIQNPDGHRRPREGRKGWDASSRREEAQRSVPRSYDY